ncbi:MAG: VOC family protein [Pseudomonadota bacterium]
MSGILVRCTLAAMVATALLRPLPAWADAAPDVSSTLRTTIAVRDLDASLRLFRDILGLTVRRDLTLSGEAVNRVLGTSGTTSRIVILQSGDSLLGNVALLAYDDVSPPPAAPSDLSFDAGDVALIMTTADIDGVHAALVRAGYPIVSPPIVLFERPDLAVQAREMMFVGPEGIFINLIQPGTPEAATAEQ